MEKQDTTTLDRYVVSNKIAKSQNRWRERDVLITSPPSKGDKSKLAFFMDTATIASVVTAAWL
jgi:hypothetical protein